MALHKDGEEVSDREPPTLFELSGAVVSRIMGRVEKEVWALPGPILQSILPMLNIYYLERIEKIAVKKGLSTQPIWYKLWCDIMKTRPSRLKTVKCWRKKFLETFFSNVLHGILHISSDRRLSDPSFLPLLHASQHVTQLTIYNMLEGVTELMTEHNKTVLENLAVSLSSLTFRHLLTSSLPTRQQLSLFLHRLIHHGAVNHVAMYCWPNADPELLVLILKMSAGIWHPGRTLVNQESFCHFCRKKSVDWSQKLDQEHKSLLGSSWLFHRPAVSQISNEDERNVKEPASGFENATELARTSSETHNIPEDSRLSCDPLHSSIQFNGNSDIYNAAAGSIILSQAETFQGSPALGKPQKRCKAATPLKHSCQERTRKATTESEDLYDFVFAIAKEEKDQRTTEERENSANCCPFPAEDDLVCTDGARPIGITSLKATAHFRSVSILEVVSVPLTRNMCQMLGNLLSSWVTLEKLILSLTELGPCIFNILSGLRALSHHSDYCLRVVNISDVFSHSPCISLVHSILSAVPLLQMLLVSFDRKTPMECSMSEGSLGLLEEDFPESHLEHLEIRFPRESLQTSLLVTVLKASRGLQSLSLDSGTITFSEEVGFLLKALKEYNPNLKKLSFHDINLSGHPQEVLFLLQEQDPILQEITFSFCRLFENCTAGFFTEIINVVKNNSSLKSLKLPGNRLGNHRLVALADIFSEDSSSSISHLDVSSNCIKPDGLLEFAKKLESCMSQRREQMKFTKLCLYQNWLDQDAATAQEALRRLKTMCNVVSDVWDSSQAFADYISVM